MPDFTYTARTLSGDRVSGTINAGNDREAVSMLTGQSLFPIEVKLQKVNRNFLGGKRVNGQLMATTYAQLASLMRSGVALLRSIQVLKEQSSNDRLKEVLQDVHDRIEDGSSMGDAMARHPRVFSEMALSLIHI